MPRVKIDYIVSFSSEDPEHPASNLLAWEVSKKKWLCKSGEPSCSVVLQLTRAVKISSVNIGAHQAAFVEVLVGRSETPNDEFQVLVPTSVFLSPAESRRGAGAGTGAGAGAGTERVRSFSGEQLGAGARAQRWDRVRLVCTQPHNAHCQYGLSFVHIHEPEGAPPPRLFALDALSSDDEEFKPGELFAKHAQKQTPTDTSANINTGAQIRQATSQALKNKEDSSTKLVKTGLASTIGKRESFTPDDSRAADRAREALLYSGDDALPHHKIDRLVHKHNDQKRNEDYSKNRTDKNDKLNNSVDQRKHDKKDVKKISKEIVDSETRDKRDSKNNKEISTMTKAAKEHKPHNNSDRNSTIATHSNNSDNLSDLDGRKKRRHSDGERKKKGAGVRASSEPHTVLRDAVLVLSGYQNPRRAALRNTALAMGARVERDWGPACTHLICAFPNTPKLRQVRAGPAGGSVPVVRAEWLEQCARRRARLPWRWFATETKHRQGPDPDYDEHDDPVQDDSEPDCDTDEEIEKILRDQKKRKTIESPRDDALDSPGDGRLDPDDRERRSSDSRVHQRLESPRSSNGCTGAEPYDGATDEEDPGAAPPARRCALPDFFDGYTFLIDEAIDPRFDVRLLARYIRAYGGVVVEAAQLDKDTEVSFTLSSSNNSSNSAARGVRVTPRWVWRCHAARALLPAD